jgi:putative transcriptional regulator
MKIILQRYRIAANFSQTELASKLGVSKNHISEIERGKRMPSPYLLVRIADELNICPGDLVDFCEGCVKNNKSNCKKHFF